MLSEAERMIDKLLVSLIHIREELNDIVLDDDELDAEEHLDDAVVSIKTAIVHLKLAYQSIE